MRVLRTRLPGVAVIEPKVHGDPRGYFFEVWNQPQFAQHGIEFDTRQVNVSRSAHGVLRGLHYQWPNPQGKLVWVLEGEVYDVAVDIRRGSPHFGQWEAAVLSAENHRQFWIPEGFAHGFAVLSEYATFAYLCTRPYDREADAGIRWNDPKLAINWPVAHPQLSDKDIKAPLLDQVITERLPLFCP